MSIVHNDKRDLIKIRDRYMDTLNSARRAKLYQAFDTIINLIEDLSEDDIVEIESKMGPAHNQYHRRNDGYGYDYSRGGYS